LLICGKTNFVFPHILKIKCQKQIYFPPINITITTILLYIIRTRTEKRDIIILMKVSVLQENLVKGLSVTSRSTTTKSQLPVLGNILLATKKGKLKLSATDLETGVNFYLGAKVEKEGAITIPSKVLLEFVSSLSAGKVDLEVKGDSLRLSSGNFKAEINGIGAAEFPKISGFSGQPSLVFEMKDFKEMVDQVVFAAATDEGRPVLTGVRLAMGSNGLVLAATDGYRLSVKKIKDFKFKELKKALIIPARTLQEVARIKDEGKVKILLMKKNNQMVFGFEDVEVVTRLIEGDFPSFEKIIPEEKKTSLIVEREEMMKAVKIAAIFARETVNIVKFQISNDKLQISANAPQVGSNVSEIEVKTEGEENKIAFNFRYLLDFLNSVSDEEIIFEMTGPLNPGVFKPKDDVSLLHVIMPVRIQK